MRETSFFNQGDLRKAEAFFRKKQALVVKRRQGSGGVIQNAFLGFQVSQTFPDIEGISPSLARVGFPGSQPQGMNSPVAWWCCRALNCLRISATLRPMGAARICMAWITLCGSIKK